MRKDAALLAEIGHFYERKVDDVSLAQAAACYQHAFELAPSSDLAFYWTRAALQSGDYEDGKHALRELEAIDPRRSRSVFLRQHPTMLRGYGGEVGRAIFRGLDREPEKKATKFLLDERGSPNECRKKKLDDLPVFKQDQNNVNGLPRQR